MNSKSSTNTSKLFAIVAGVLFVAVFVVENINHRFWLNDFKVFYMAADAMIQGKQVYGIPFGLDTGFYKYSPFILVLFAPFTLLPFEIAAVVYFFIVAACSIVVILLLHRIITKYYFEGRRITFLILFLSLLSIINHLVRELHLGNTNIILILLITLVLKHAIEGKHILAGILLSIVVLTKPYFAVCVFPLLLFGKERTVFSAFLSTSVFILITMIVTGFGSGSALFVEWMNSMKEHSSYLESRHTIFSLLKTYSGISIDPSVGIYVFGAIAVLLFLYFYQFRKQGDAESNTRGLVLYLFLLLSLVPTILITDTEHFLFSLPLIVLLLIYVAELKNPFAVFLMVILMFLYGGNSSDLVGKKLSGVFEEYGFLGISNLIIIITIFILGKKLFKVNLLKSA